MATVLFVDDETSFLSSLRRMLKMQLSQWHYEFAASGREALNRVSQGGIDVVVTDLKMPDFDGLQLLDSLKKKPGIRCTPVIVLTGKGDEESAVKAMHLGAADYLVKDTVTRQSLERAIINALEKLKLRQQAEQYHNQLEQKIHELEATLARVKLLEGLLPICMFCKRIRTDGNKWQQLESYIVKHSEVEFSHSLCNSCKAEYFPRSMEKKE